jgi:hypothetical protein
MTQTHAEAAPQTFALVEPLMRDITRALHGQDVQLVTIAVLHVTVSMMKNKVLGPRPSPVLERGMDELDAFLSALYDRYELFLKRQVRQ